MTMEDSDGTLSVVSPLLQFLPGALKIDVGVQDNNDDAAVLCTICHAREPAFTAKTIFWVDCEGYGALVHSYTVLSKTTVFHANTPVNCALVLSG